MEDEEMMTTIKSILFCIFLLPLSDGTHFEGGTITYKVLNTSGSTVSILLTQTYIYDYTVIPCNNSMITNQTPKLYFNPLVYAENSKTVACIQYCNQSGGYVAPGVVSACTDYSVGLDITVGQRSDVINITNGSYFNVAYQSAAWRKLSLPSGSGGTNNNWSISSLIDLRLRSNGKYNSPPVATIISPIFIPVGIQQAILIPTIDNDNDQVRCRFASGTNECGSTCPPSSLPNGTSIFSNCTFLITGVKVNDWYAVTLMIEDFVDSNATTPLSSVPVQFLINVQNVSNCSQKPLLTSASTTTAACVGLQVGQSYAVQLIARSYCSNVNITDIATLSFPVVIKTPLVRNSTDTWSVTLTWIPTAAAIGSQILCAVAIDTQNVQSNQYCMAFTVAQETAPTCPGQPAATTQLISQSLTSSTQSTIQQTTVSTTTVSTSLTTQETTAVNLMTSVSSSSMSTMLSVTDSSETTETAMESTTTTPTESSTETAMVSTIIIPTESSTITLNVITTESTTLSTTSKSSFPWLWILIAASSAGLLLATLALCCCCWFCCRPCFFCCPPKQRRKDSTLSEMSRDETEVYTFRDSFEHRRGSTPIPWAERSISSSVTPRVIHSSTNRDVGDVQVEIPLTRQQWRIIRYHHVSPSVSPRVAPSSLSSSSMTDRSRE